MMNRLVYPYQNFKTALAWSGRAADARALGNTTAVDAQLPRAGSPEVLGNVQHLKKGVVYADSAKAMLGKSWKQQIAMGGPVAMSARKMLGKNYRREVDMGDYVAVGEVMAETGMGCACDGKKTMAGFDDVVTTVAKPTHMITNAIGVNLSNGAAAAVTVGLGLLAYKALKKRR